VTFQLCLILSNIYCLTKINQQVVDIRSEFRQFSGCFSVDFDNSLRLDGTVSANCEIMNQSNRQFASGGFDVTAVVAVRINDRNGVPCAAAVPVMHIQ
jgi:hypothetical protein